MTGAGNTYDLLTYVWSEGFDLHYEFGGDEGGADSVLWRGDFPNRNFVCFHVREDRLSAFIAVNPEDELLGALETLVKKRVEVAPIAEKLEDAAAPLSECLPET